MRRRGGSAPCPYPESRRRVSLVLPPTAFRACGATPRYARSLSSKDTWTAFGVEAGRGAFYLAETEGWQSG